MKLAKVIHIRCHERNFDEPCTFVWVDDAMTAEEFESFVEAARDAYDRAGQEFQAANEPPYVPWLQQQYEKHPDKTVAEIRDLHATAQAAYGQWRKIKEEAQKDFMYHLAAVSDGRIHTFWSQKSSITCELDWGHRHGQNVDYAETVIQNLGGSVQRDDEIGL